MDFSYTIYENVFSILNFLPSLAIVIFKFWRTLFWFNVMVHNMVHVEVCTTISTTSGDCISYRYRWCISFKSHFSEPLLQDWTEDRCSIYLGSEARSSHNLIISYSYGEVAVDSTMLLAEHTTLLLWRQWAR